MLLASLLLAGLATASNLHLQARQATNCAQACPASVATIAGHCDEYLKNQRPEHEAQCKEVCKPDVTAAWTQCTTCIGQMHGPENAKMFTDAHTKVCGAGAGSQTPMTGPNAPIVEGGAGSANNSAISISIAPAAVIFGFLASAMV